MKKKCSLCGNYEDIVAENNFGFRYLCRDCCTLIYIRYNPKLYTFDEAKKLTNDILCRMKKQFVENMQLE